MAKGKTKKKKAARRNQEKKRNENPPAVDADNPEDSSDQHHRGNDVEIFSYGELEEITNDPAAIIGDGAFGNVYKGTLQGQIVAVKKLSPFSQQGDPEFRSEIILLSLLRHPNIVKLIGFCAEKIERKQRLLVYEFMPLGSLDKLLFGPQEDSNPLDWKTRMAIAAGVASGLKYLHNQASPRVIFNDLNAANILLDQSFNPKLSDFGMAEFGPTANAQYYASETKYDVYNFGLVLVGLITGRKSQEIVGLTEELCDWLYSMRKKLHEVVDSRLREEKYESRSLRRAVNVALMCLHKYPAKRPKMPKVVEEMNLAASEAKAS